MALLRWGFEEEEQKDPLTPTTTTIQSVQSGWQPTSGGQTNTLGDDGSDNSSSNQSQSYLMSEEKAQYDENMRQQRAAEEAARRQAAAEAAAQAAANAERARQAQAAQAASQAAQPQRQPGQKYANKSKKEEGGLWGFLKGIGAGIQQGIGAVGDIAIQGGAVLGSIGKNDQELVKHMAEAERARKWLHNRRDITGNKFVGTRDIDQNASRIAAGRGDSRDFMAVAGKSLQAGIDATMFMNPARIATKGLTPAVSQGANILARTARNPAVRYAARDAAFFGTLQGTATFQSVYGQTGDLEAATEAALKDAAIGGALQGTLDLAGSGVGVMANRTMNSLRQGRRYTPVVDAPRGVDDVPIIPQERTTPAVNTHQPTDGNVNFQGKTSEPQYTPVAENLTPTVDGLAMPTRPEADMAEVPAPPVDPTLDPNTPPVDTPEVPADATPVVADGVPAPVQPVPATDPNMPRIKSEEVRELQEARAGTTQAEEAEINQRVQQLADETPKTSEQIEAERQRRALDDIIMGRDTVRPRTEVEASRIEADAELRSDLVPEYLPSSPSKLLTANSRIHKIDVPNMLREAKLSQPEIDSVMSSLFKNNKNVSYKRIREAVDRLDDTPRVDVEADTAPSGRKFNKKVDATDASMMRLSDEFEQFRSEHSEWAKGTRATEIGDVDSKPKMYYHRSDADFDSFKKMTEKPEYRDTGEEGIYFSDKPGDDYYGKNEYAVILDAKKPYRGRDIDSSMLDTETVERLKSEGYDSVDGNGEFVVFEPEQIKIFAKNGYTTTPRSTPYDPLDAPQKDSAKIPQVEANDKAPDLNSVKPYSGGLDDTHQTRINSLRRNADVMSRNAEITQRDIDRAQASIDMWNDGGKVSPGLKATLTKEKAQAESYRKAQQILETSAPNRIYATDAKGNVVEHPASHILEAFSKSVGEDMPPIVISGRPHDRTGFNFGSMTRNANGTYAHTLGVIKYKSKNSVYHETIHNIDMSIRDYKGENPKMLKLQQLRKEITPAEVAKFRKLEGRVKNDREYVAYAMEQLYDGRINANKLGTGVLKYIKEFFGEIRDAFSSSTLYNRPKFNDAVEYIKELDKAIHQVDKELTKRSKKPTPKAATPIKSKTSTKPATPKPATPKPATPKPRSGFVEPPPVQPTKPKSAPTPVKPKGVKPASATKPEPKPVKPVATKPKSNLPEGMNPVKPSETPAGSSPTTPKKPKKTITPEKQARKDFANVFTRSTNTNSDMEARLRSATGMTQETGSEVAQILKDGGVTGKQAERITELFDQAAKLAESNKAIQKQYRKDFIKGGKDAIDDAPARQRNRETEEAAYIRNQLNAELKKLERKGDLGEKLTQDFENVISGKNVNQLIGAPIERGLTAEVIGNAMNTIKAPVRQIRGATKHGMPGKSAVKRLIRELKTPPKTVTEGYKYLLGNTYRAAMTPAQALADSRKGALRTELTKYAYQAKIGKTLSNSDAEKVSRMAGNDMEALVNMGAGVDNGMVSIFAYRKALKQWKKFIESGSEADYGKFMDTIDRQTSIVDKLAQGFSTQGKNRAQRAGLTLVNALLPYMRNAVNMSTRGVVLDLNPFTLSLLDGIRTDQRGFMSNLALGAKNKTVDYAVLAALGSVLTYNDGTDPDTVDQPRGVSIHLGGDEYFAIRGTPLELPLGAIMVAKQLAQDGVEGNFKDVGYYGGMITPSIPYADYMTSHGNVIDSIEKLGTEEGDGGYAAKNFLVGNAKSLTPFSNNNIEASLSRFGDDESLTAKTVYDKDMGQWYLNSLANNNLGKVLPFVPDRSELKDSRDAAGRVRTVDNQGSWMRKKINDADTATYNDTITDLVKFAREEGLGKGTQDMFNTYPDGKDNNFKSVQDSITFFGVERGKSPDPADKLKSNEKLGELAAQIREGFYGDSGMDLLTLDGQELKSDASIPNKSGTKNSKLPLNMQSIKNAIAHTDLPEADRNRMYEISKANQELYAQRKAKVITYDQEQALKAENEKEYVAILSRSKNYKKMQDLMDELDGQGFFEKGGFGSTKSGQTYLWNSLNALLGAKGATPAANYPEAAKGFTPWGRRGGSGKRSLKATIKPGKSGSDGIKWTPVGKRQMASVARAKYTPLDIRVKLGNEVKRDKTQNYSSRSF